MMAYLPTSAAAATGRGRQRPPSSGPAPPVAGAACVVRAYVELLVRADLELAVGAHPHPLETGRHAVARRR